MCIIGRDIDEITGEILDMSYKLHTSLGPGLVEPVYELVLDRQLKGRGMHVERQKSISFEFDGLRFADGFRADLLVEGLVDGPGRRARKRTRRHCQSS